MGKEETARSSVTLQEAESELREATTHAPSLIGGQGWAFQPQVQPALASCF